MRTVRRLYFYLVAFISAEVVVWGVISLLRTIFDRQTVGFTTNALAGGLAALIVGLPIFLLHWSVVQKDAHKDPDEHASRLRALFLYGLRFALLLPAVQSVMALLNRLIIQFVFSGRLPNEFIGANQSWTDNLVALAVNLLALAYFERILTADWAASFPKENLTVLRRLFRYAWMLYTLGVTVFGMALVLRFVFYRTGDTLNLSTRWLAGGLAMLIAGVPLWLWIWSIIQRSLADPEERRSMLRLVVLYALSLVGVIVVLFTAGDLLASLVRLALGEQKTFLRWLSDNSVAFAVVIPFGVVWSYFGRKLGEQIATEEDPFRRAMLVRVYRYILAFLGNAATFISLVLLLYAFVDLIVFQVVSLANVRVQIGGGVAGLVIGLPVWLWAWRPLQAEARALTEQGSQARRSVLRKGYLYLVIFLTVIGGMAAAGMLLYLVFRYVLGQVEFGFWAILSRRVVLLVLVLIWLWYHLQTLRSDGSMAERALSAKHVSFPVLILHAHQEALVSEIVQDLQRQAPQMPVAVHSIEAGIPEEEYSAAKAVVMPASLALQPPEALRLWLDQFGGKWVVIPETDGEVTWPGVLERDLHAQAQEVARAVRMLSEGERPRASLPTNPWTVVGYVLAGLIGLFLLFLITSLVFNGIG